MGNFEITEKRIYQLLKHPYQTDKSIADDLHTAYDEFVEELFDYLNKETDKRKIIRKLNVIYVEFATIKSLESVSPTKENRLKIIFLDKLVSFVDREMELILRQMEFPNFFISVDSDWKSPLYIDESTIKLIDIMELVCGLFYLTGSIFRLDRKELFLTDMARMFEKTFNISFGDIHRKEDAVIKRKPEKMTEFLDRLKAAIIQKSKEKGYS